MAGNPISSVDPNGQWIQAAVGGVIGAVSGGLGAYGSCGSLSDIVQGAVIGGILGAVTATVPIAGSALRAMLVNGAAGAVGNMVGQGISGGGANISWSQVSMQGAISAVGGGFGNMVGLGVGVSMVRSGATSANAINTSQGIGTLAAIGIGFGQNLSVSSSAGGSCP